MIRRIQRAPRIRKRKKVFLNKTVEKVLLGVYTALESIFSFARLRVSEPYLYHLKESMLSQYKSEQQETYKDDKVRKSRLPILFYCMGILHERRKL